MIFNFSDSKDFLRSDYIYFNDFTFKNKFDVEKISKFQADFSDNYYKCYNNFASRTDIKYSKEFTTVFLKWFYISSFYLPTYMYLLPTIINTDWLANVDWKSYHRDHLLHQPLTAYVVKKLLTDKKNSFLFSKNDYLDKISESLSKFESIPFVEKYLLNLGLPKSSLWLAKNDVSKQMWKDFFIETSFKAALFHDLGYPWQHQNKENMIVDDFTNPVLCNNISDKTKNIFIDYPLLTYVLNGYRDRSRCIKNFENNIPHLKCMFNCCAYENQKNEDNKMDRFCGRVDEMYFKTHGLPGALHFLYLQDGFKKDDSIEHPIKRLSLEWAASAIAMHDMCKIYWGNKNSNKKPNVPCLKIDAENDPISAIVTLADTLQEFERPVSKFTKNKDGNVKIEYDIACSSTEIDLDENKCLIIKYFMKDLDSYCHKLEAIEEDQKKLFDPINGFLDLSSWGIEKVKMEAVYDPSLEKPDDKKPDKKD